MKNIYTSVFALVALILIGISAQAQRKYSEIFADMPNMSLDQTYSELMHFQKQNPYFANTYIQLGMVCEHKMALTDPLRDIESALFWADNAHLFFGNFLVFYQSGDYRSNSEYYENLNIPHSGSKITEEDIKEFVSAHEKKCKNFRDSTFMIYTAIEKSKEGYNRSIQAYSKLCERFVNYNDMLLAYDTTVESMLKELENGIDQCETQFKEYKRLTKIYPVLNYRQIYDKQNIETYRLDGLTYSDFYQNRFTIWDFKKWVDDYRAELNNAILPLRSEIEKIDAQYKAGKAEYEKKVQLSAALTAPYDELFIFRLGKYDNNSLVRELLKYLELRRNMIAMAGDTLLSKTQGSANLMNRKMRSIYKLHQLKQSATAQLAEVQNFVTPERIARFAQFFSKNYGGADGLKRFEKDELVFLSEIETATLQNFSSYCVSVAEVQKKASFSQKGKAAALPTWCVSDYEVGQVTGNYITQQVVRDQYGRPTYLAGVKKADLKAPFVARIDEQNTTTWLTDVKGANNIVALSPMAQGCIVCTTIKDVPTAIAYENGTKETFRFALHSANVAFINYNEMTKMTHAAFNDADGVYFTLTDSLGRNVSEMKLPNITEATHIQNITNGALVIGVNAGNIVVMQVPDAGVILEPLVIKGNNLKVSNIFRASANEIVIFTTNEQGERQLIVVDADGYPK